MLSMVGPCDILFEMDLLDEIEDHNLIKIY